MYRVFSFQITKEQRVEETTFITFTFVWFNQENFEKISKVFINSITDFSSLIKNVVSSAHVVYRNGFFENIKAIDIFILH